MRILTRYILREVLSHALIGAAVFTFVVFLRDLEHILELVVRASAPLPSVAELFFFTIPTALTVTIPMAVLVGILIGLSRLAADSEVTAMRASGMGVATLARIISVFVIAAWLLALVNNVFWAPRSAAAVGRLQDRLKTSQVSFEVQPRVFYERFKNLVLYVQDVTNSGGRAVWKGVFLADISTPGAPNIILAQEGVLIPEGPHQLHLHLRHGSQHQSIPRSPDQYSIQTFNQLDREIPAVEEQVREQAPVAEIPTRQLRATARSFADPSRARLYEIEFHRRLALPTACIVLAMVGIPLGLSAKKGGKSTGMVLTIALVFVYYVISLFGVSLARQGQLSPFTGVWVANILFFLGGTVLLARVDSMPMEIGSLQAAWQGLRQRAVVRKEAITGVGPDAFQRAYQRKRVFSARFPLLLDDYILRDFSSYLAMIVATFLMLALVFTFFELFRDLVGNKVPWSVMGEYLLTVSPYQIYQTTHLSMLLAVLITLGLMQKSNEITAMKASGISIYRIVVPILVIGALVATGLFFLDQFYLPKVNKRQDALRNRIKGNPPQTYLRPDRKWILDPHSNSFYTIYYYEFFDPDRNQFASVSAFELDPHTFQISKRIYATRAHWEDALQNWVYEQGWERGFRGSAITHFRQFQVSTFAELSQPPTYFKKEVKQSSEMNYEELRNYIHDLERSGFDVVRLRVQLAEKFSFPLITLVMAVLGVPFALSAGQRGALTGVAIAIGLAALYIVVARLFEAMGNLNQLPPALAAWSPDVIFALTGGYLVLKVPT
jgi:LPS export ABC transporter permease LptF/LPS export ABC transporter permease LptG